MVTIFKGESKHFPEDTIVDLNSYKEIPRETLKKVYIKGTAKILGPLEEQILTRINTAVKKAQILSERIIKRII